MPAFQIIEAKKPGPGVFSPRGAVKQLWQTRDFEVMISGPAETGKTYGMLHYGDALLWKYSGAQGVLVRKVYSDLRASALITYRRVLGENSPVKPYGGEKPEWFDYPNGSRLWLCGLDNPGKALSTERDFFLVNQAEQLALDDWEIITTRATGRAAVMPYTRVVGECNPGHPTHWILAREQARTLVRLNSQHRDNPTLYDDAGNLTEQGRKTLSILENLTGTRRERLLYGRWAAAEGIVYEEWDPTVHVCDAFDVPRDWPVYWCVDFGFNHPFVWGAWCESPDGDLYCFRQIYHTGRLVEDHARQILEVSGWTFQGGLLVPTRPRPDSLPLAVICDHDLEDRATLERHTGIRTVPAYKDVRTGIEAVKTRLRKNGCGKPRLYIMRGSLVERDPALMEARKPSSGEDEIPGYVWDPRRPDRPLKVGDDFSDMMRYLVCYVDSIAVDPYAFEGYTEMADRYEISPV